MQIIYTTNVYCDTCKRNVASLVVTSDNMKELSEELKERAKYMVLDEHNQNKHDCWKCNKPIKPDGAEHIIDYEEGEIKGLLCEDCAKIESTKA